MKNVRLEFILKIEKRSPRGPCRAVVDGGFEIWGGHDVIRGCVCTAKLLVNFSLQIYQLVHHVMWVNSVVS